MHQISFWIAHYGVLVVFASVLVDLLGAPLPSYPALLVAGALSLSGGSSVATVIVAGIAGGLIADLVWYALGARLGRPVLALLCRFTLSPDSCVRQTEDVFTRTGPWSLVFAKFVPGLGYVSVALSGITRVSLPLFILMDGIGDALYVTLPVALGRIFHNAVDSILVRLAQLGELGIVIVAGLLLIYLAARWIERLAFMRRLRMDRITVDELVQMIDGGNPPIIFDVRPSPARQKEGVIPGAIAAHASDIRSLVEKYPRDVEIVVYCACPNEATAATAALHLKRAGFKKIRPLLGGIEAWSRAGRSLEAGASA
jgi:membrane protein DedA with SNARE-associated domain/rhodanese-related sulfurtransferase